MTGLLPLGARKIGLVWPVQEGGFGVTACTDSAGQPVIGLYPLNPEGRPSGQETSYAYQRLLIRLVVGYDTDRRAIIVFADIEVAPRGLLLRVVIPPNLAARELDTHLSVKWGSKPPSFYEAPANGNWPGEPAIRGT